MVINNKESMGQLIQSRRKSRRIDQEELAEIAGISARTLRAIEKGTANPEFDTMVRICEVLGMEIRIEVIQ